MSDHGDLRRDLRNNREREKTKRDGRKQWEELHTDHRIILHAPHERYSTVRFLCALAASDQSINRRSAVSLSERHPTHP